MKFKAAGKGAGHLRGIEVSAFWCQAVTEKSIRGTWSNVWACFPIGMHQIGKKITLEDIKRL